MSQELVEEVASLALRYVTDPPTGAAPVVDFSSPDDLLETFESGVPLPFEDRSNPVSEAALVAAMRLVIKHSVQTAHPRFLNQNFAGPDPISVVGDWLGAALNTTGATFEAAPVFTLMESALLHKLGRFAGYVDGGADVPMLPPGLFCPGGSSATLYALQLARHRLEPDAVRVGASGRRLVLFVSSSGHYAATKSASLMGLGTEAVIKVATDQHGAMRPKALEAEIAAANVRGEVPFTVIATAGTTVTSAFDDIHALADVCGSHDLWLHVDGCYGGSALFSPEQEHLLAGLERSDSFVWNLHKMMGMTQQCTALLVKDPTQLAPCFACRADYIFQPDKLYTEYDSGDRTFQCARRIDSLKLWLSWKAHGDDGFAARIDHAVAMAAHARQQIEESDGALVEVAGSFTNVVFAWVPPDLRPLELDVRSIAALAPDTRDRLHGLPPKIKARMQREGTAMVGYQPVHGLNTFRLLFMNPTVTTRDVDAVLSVIAQYGSSEA